MSNGSQYIQYNKENIKDLLLALSLLRTLRWNREGAKQTAIFVGVIWFSSTQATTSWRKKRRHWRASRFSSGRRKMAAWAAANCWSFGKSAEDERNQTLRNVCDSRFFRDTVERGLLVNAYTGRCAGNSRTACRRRWARVGLWNIALSCRRRRTRTGPQRKSRRGRPRSCPVDTEFEIWPQTSGRGQPVEHRRQDGGRWRRWGLNHDPIALKTTLLTRQKLLLPWPFFLEIVLRISPDPGILS